MACGEVAEVAMQPCHALGPPTPILSINGQVYLFKHVRMYILSNTIASAPESAHKVLGVGSATERET